MAACFVPYNSRNLDVSFLVLKPTVVFVDELVEALRHFSLWTETLGCIHSSILQSIHGNMILWYGAWMKRSDENKELLNAAILTMATNISSMAVLMDNSFFEAYAGESKDGSPATKFSTGDTIAVCVSTTHSDDDKYDLPYAILAMFKSRFMKMEGATSGVCLKKCNIDTRTTRSSDLVLNIYTWKSLQSCYSYLLTSDIRTVVLPYMKGELSIDVKYDIFRVLYVSGDHNLHYYSWPPHDRMLEGI